MVVKACTDKRPNYHHHTVVSEFKQSTSHNNHYSVYDLQGTALEIVLHWTVPTDPAMSVGRQMSQVFCIFIPSS